VPYLHADPELVNLWQDRLKSVPGFRVGICWQGSPRHKSDRRRSVPLTLFGPLGQVPGVSLVSLQKGPGGEQLEQMPEMALDVSSGLMEFADTAAVMKNLDLIISVDTSVVHLAGALDVPVWVPVSHAPDWRWLLEREDSPWYPSLRLFRQVESQGWDAVFGRLHTALIGRLS
jgi:Glycosyltransferase family 9 (heptosyltransferase)